MTIFWMFIGLFAMILMGIPIAIALALVAVFAMIITQGVDILPNVALVMFDGATKFSLLAIPLFIFAGAIMNTGGISRRLIAFASALVGFVRGGLAMVNIAASMFFAEMSGSAVADVAALGSILIPAMKKKGYPGPFAAAVTSSSATLAVIIPPSIPMILYAVMADSSVVQLFVAGIIPGLIGGLTMMALSYWFALRHNYPVEENFELKKLWRTFKSASWAFLLPLIILGGIFGGLVTALRTLTALPVPGRDAVTLTAALPWFPAVGLLLGALLYGFAIGLSHLTAGRWPAGVAVAVVVAGVLLTRGLHLDGLADWADGFWGARDREKSLAIMKDSCVGAFGAVAIVCVLLAKWVCLAALLERNDAEWILAALVISRTMQVYLAVSQPYARAEGGTAAPFVKGATKRHRALTVFGALVLLLAAGHLDWMWLFAFALAWVATRFFGRWCRRRVGGITGDLLGACSELTETLALAFGVVVCLHLGSTV